MRACGEYEDMISAFIDGALAEEDRRALMAHMAGCPACQNYFDEQIAIQDALTAAAAQEDIQAPEGFAEDVMARIRFTAQEKPQIWKRTVPRWQTWAALAACCAIAAVGVWKTGSFEKNGQPQTAVTVRSTVEEAEDTAADLPEMSRAVPEYDGYYVEDAVPEENGNVRHSPMEDRADTDTSAATGGAVSAAEDAPRKETEKNTDQEIDLHMMQDAASSKSAPAQAAPPFNTANGMENDSSIAGEPRVQAAEAPETYQCVLTTASPAAAVWVEEQLGLCWEVGAHYELSEEEYAQLRLLLAESGEDFSEQPEGGEGFLLIAETSWETD